MSNLQNVTPAFAAKDFNMNVFRRADDLFGPTVTYSSFKSKNAKASMRVTESFNELALRCHTPVVRAANDGPTFSPFTFRHHHFHEVHALECGVLAFKFEKVRSSTRSRDILACVDGFSSFVYSTHSHSLAEQPVGSYQLIVALRTPIPKQYFKVVVMHFGTRFCRLSGIINSSYMSWNQKVQFPSCPASQLHQFVVQRQVGRAYDWLPDFLEHQAPKSSGSWGVQ